MAKNDNLKDYLIDLANAIRTTKGTTDLINPQDFSAEILSLSATSGSPKFGELVDGSIQSVESGDLSEINEIRDVAFINCKKLTSVVVPSNVTTIGASAFEGCSSLQTLVISDGVTTIGASAFKGINASVTNIPSTLSVLETEVFADNLALTSITIPENITEIKDNAFSGCTNLTEITMESMTPPSVTNISLPSSVTAIYVKYGAYDTYKAQWTDYADKIVRLPAIPSTITIIVNNYLNELVQGATVTIEGNGQAFTGTTNENGVFTQGDLQPATYTVSVADLEGFKTPEPVEIVVEENTQNSATFTYLEKSLYIPFSQLTPAEISAIGNEIAYKGLTSAEVESNYGWSIGDTTSYTLSTGENVEMRIIGFNHDDLSDGSGKAGITLQMVNCLATRYLINSSATNAGGYATSKLKITELPSIKATLPQEWQNVIKLVNKKSANGGSSNYTETLTTSEDLFLLSEKEVCGNITAAQDGENEGNQYEYWVNKVSGDRIKYFDSDGDGVPEKATIWWLRSCAQTSNSFRAVSTSGGITQYVVSSARGVSFAFCVGSASDYVPSGGEDTPTFSRTFSENTPEVISAVSAEISANNMTSQQVYETYGWNLGDTISYTLSTGEKVEMRIIGFNHDDLSDGSGKAGITLEMTHGTATTYNSNTYDTNAGGYAQTLLKTRHFPSIKATLPQEWQNVIKLVNKKSANGGSTNYSEMLTLSEDLFLLAEIEVFGTVDRAQNGTQEGSVYEYWDGKEKADRIKRYDSDGDGVVDTAFASILRSSSSTATHAFCMVSSSGNITHGGPSFDRHISFAFCV